MSNAYPIGRKFAHLLDVKTTEEIEEILREDGLLRNDDNGAIDEITRILEALEGDDAEETPANSPLTKTTPVDKAIDLLEATILQENPIEQETIRQFKTPGYTVPVGQFTLTGAVLRGKISHTRQMAGENNGQDSFCLSTEIDFDKVLELQSEPDSRLTDEFTRNQLQIRTKMLQAGPFGTIEEANTYAQNLNDAVLHVLAQKGAQGSVLKTKEDHTNLSLQKTPDASSQTFGDAMITASRIARFNSSLGQEKPDILTLVNIVLPAALENCDQAYYYQDDKETKHKSVHLVFGNETGEFCFENDTQDTAQTIMTHWTYSDDEQKDPKVLFEGALTADILQTYLLPAISSAEDHSLKIEGIETDVSSTNLPYEAVNIIPKDQPTPLKTNFEIINGTPPKYKQQSEEQVRKPDLP